MPHLMQLRLIPIMAANGRKAADTTRAEPTADYCAPVLLVKFRQRVKSAHLSQSSLRR